MPKKEDNSLSIEGQFMDLDAKIVESEQRFISLIKEKAQIDKSIQELSATLFTELASERGEDGKPKYPNKETREQELINRLANNKSYIDSVSAESKINEDLQMLQISIDSLKRQFSSLKALCYRGVSV